jgi:hypothetical protein
MPPLEPPPQVHGGTPIIKPRTPEQQSWGTIVSIIIIVAMIVVGALYAWGKRIAQQNSIIEQTKSQSQTY